MSDLPREKPGSVRLLATAFLITTVVAIGCVPESAVDAAAAPRLEEGGGKGERESSANGTSGVRQGHCHCSVPSTATSDAVSSACYAVTPDEHAHEITNARPRAVAHAPASR